MYAETCKPVLLIRPDGNESDADALRQVGLDSVIAPLLSLTACPTAATRELAGVLAQAQAGWWLVLTSPRAWSLWRQSVPDLDVRLAAAAARGLQVACVGAVTTASLPESPLVTPMTSTGISAEDLLEALLDAAPSTSRPQAILPLSARARSVLVDGLRNAGWQVHHAAVYDTRRVATAPTAIDDLAEGRFAGVVVRSPSAAEALADFAAIPDSTTVFAVGPISAARCRKHGWRVVEVGSTRAADLAVQVSDLLPRC